MHNGFHRELARFGPHTGYPSVSLSQARKYCASLARSHYENFTVASVFLPRRLQSHFHAIYAYCRWSDDLADECGGGPESLALLRWWRGELDRCYDGCPRHPVMVALLDTITRFAIPAKPFQDLLFAFEQDQLVKNYQSFAQLLGYCSHSANPVGHLILYLFRCFDSRRAALADEICTGLQLANFWQDVARDWDIGRVYLPQEDRNRFGYSDGDLCQRRYSREFADLMRFQVERARGFFHKGMALPGLVPAELQLDVELFIQGGLKILKKIEEAEYNVWATRPELARWEKAALLAATALRRARRIIPRLVP
jgi:squalene synthase HpnC